MTRTDATRQHPAVSRDVTSNARAERLRTTLSLSGLGHWLTLPALTAMAGVLTRDDDLAVRAQAVGLVLAAWLLPLVVLPPAGAAVAARLDRRIALLSADAARAVLVLSVPLVDLLIPAINPLLWTGVAAVLVSLAGLVWAAAADGCAPPAGDGDAERRSLWRSVFAMAPFAALLFTFLALVADGVLDVPDRAHLALYATFAIFAVTALLSGLTRDLPAGPAPAAAVEAPVVALVRRSGEAGAPGLLFAVAATALATGSLLALAKVHARELGGGDPGYGMVLVALAAGIAFGVFLGPRVLGPFSRRRLLGLAVVAAALALLVIALVQNLVVVVFVTAFLGVAAGIVWAAATLTAAPAVRPRAAAAVVTLLAAAVAPPLAGALGVHRLKVAGAVYDFTGVGAVLLIAAVVTLVAGLLAYRRLDDRRGIPLSLDLAAALRGEVYAPPVPVELEVPRAKPERGVFIAFEGGEGAGKTTQARLAAIWLRDHGYDVVSTNEPGATKTGMRLRALLLDKETTGLSSRAETLLYAADRADHVANVIRPAMERGAIVVSDRYVDSSLAYQGYGRRQPVEEIAEVNAWATGGLVPDLTVLLEVPPETGLNRLTTEPDRMESEPRDFHDRVLAGFRALAEAHPERYLIVSADRDRSQTEISREIQERIGELLPDPVPAGTEDITSTFPAITDA
ncbi:dTMP kinase [Actinomadura hibisca]|uniref:dTMP kinase n=1 Tax=Actinomadura hibisca TaxID=68565 RepID=UPI0008344BFB|nr:dTMP kinase [Actinomadura hibisca]